ncbi:uncharacterized protein ACWYII_043207 [Salvelinus alpinus]|uniref:uncharacterized protein n=1 Tax=Salvelinus alpinus TaxID=8036 RepID=UPI0039FDA4C3
MIVDYRKRRTEHAPILIDGAVVEQVESFKFLGVHITNKLTWSKHTKTVVKRARQNLFPLRRLKIFGMGLQILKRFYSCAIGGILTGCITTWFRNCSASNCKALQMVVCTAQYITGAKLPAIQDLYTRRRQRKALKMINYPDTGAPLPLLWTLPSMPQGKGPLVLRTNVQFSVKRRFLDKFPELNRAMKVYVSIDREVPQIKGYRRFNVLGTYSKAMNMAESMIGGRLQTSGEPDVRSVQPFTKVDLGQIPLHEIIRNFQILETEKIPENPLFLYPDTPKVEGFGKYYTEKSGGEHTRVTLCLWCNGTHYIKYIETKLLFITKE